MVTAGLAGLAALLLTRCCTATPGDASRRRMAGRAHGPALSTARGSWRCRSPSSAAPRPRGARGHDPPAPVHAAALRAVLRGLRRRPAGVDGLVLLAPSRRVLWAGSWATPRCSACGWAPAPSAWSRSAAGTWPARSGRRRWSRAASPSCVRRPHPGRPDRRVEPGRAGLADRRDRRARASLTDRSRRMSWQIGMVCNAVIAVAYLLISLAIVVPLARSNQLRTNPLGAATAAIFFTCAVHHGSHAVHMLLPSLGVDDDQGLAMRAAWGWPLAIWDVVGVAGRALLLVAAPQLLLADEGRQALRGPAQARAAGARAQRHRAAGTGRRQDGPRPRRRRRSADAALTSSIASASRIITDLLGSEHFSIELLRSAPAVVDLGNAAADRRRRAQQMTAMTQATTPQSGDHRRHRGPARAAADRPGPRRLRGGRARPATAGPASRSCARPSPTSSCSTCRCR